MKVVGRVLANIILTCIHKLALLIAHSLIIFIEAKATLNVHIKNVYCLYKYNKASSLSILAETHY